MAKKKTLLVNNMTTRKDRRLFFFLLWFCVVALSIHPTLSIWSVYQMNAKAGETINVIGTAMKRIVHITYLCTNEHGNGVDDVFDLARRGAFESNGNFGLVRQQVP